MTQDLMIKYDLCDYETMRRLSLYMRQGILSNESIKVIDCATNNVLLIENVKFSFGVRNIALLRFKDSNLIQQYNIIGIKVD